MKNGRRERLKEVGERLILDGLALLEYLVGICWLAQKASENVRVIFAILCTVLRNNVRRNNVLQIPQIKSRL